MNGMQRKAAAKRKRADMVFIALARNAFDVMQRRGWWVVSAGDHPYHWRVRTKEGHDMPFDFVALDHGGYFSDPFEALVEADKWYRENKDKTS